MAKILDYPFLPIIIIFCFDESKFNDLLKNIMRTFQEKSFQQSIIRLAGLSYFLALLNAQRKTPNLS